MLAPSPSYGPVTGRFEFWFVVSAALLLATNGVGVLYVFGAIPTAVMAVLGIAGSIVAVGTGAIGFALYCNRPRLVRWVAVLTALALIVAGVLAIGYLRMVVELDQAFRSFPF